MKENAKRTKQIIYAVMLLIIIAGVIVKAVSGFKFDLLYRDHKRIDLYLGRNVALSEIEQVTKEVLKDRPVKLRKVELYGDMVAIYTEFIKQEELEELVAKMQEKYGVDYKAEDVSAVDEPGIKGMDLIKPYTFAFLLGSVLILVYFMIRYRKLGSIRIMFNTILMLLIAEVFFLSVLSVTRIEISEWTIPGCVFIYFATLVIMTFDYENAMKNLRGKEEKKS